MAEPRKVFQMEKGHIRQAMDTFRKAWAEHQKHRKREGFEREVFWLEGPTSAQPPPPPTAPPSQPHGNWSWLECGSGCCQQRAICSTLCAIRTAAKTLLLQDHATQIDG
ncbi:unnamed protein product [Gadus morhua 'NCC']